MNRSIVEMILYIKKMESKGFAPEDIRNSLLLKGYSGIDVRRAIEKSSNLLKNGITERQLSPYEQAYLTNDAIKYLYQLTYYGVLTKEQFESVVADITNYSQHKVSKDELKLLVSIMLFNENPDNLLLDDEPEELSIQ